MTSPPRSLAVLDPLPGIAIGRRITRSAPSVRGTAVAASTDAAAPAST